MVQVSEFYVYEHIRPDTGQVFYVGKGKGYRATVASKHHRNIRWQRIVAKCGSFEVNYVRRGISESDAFALEIYHIAKLRAEGVVLCNMTDGGDGISGAVRTPEWRANMSKALKGIRKSEETKRKLSESVKRCGYVPSDEVRRKISETHKGHKRSLGYRHTPEWFEEARKRTPPNKGKVGLFRHTDEHKERMSAILTGRPQPRHECPHCGKVGGNSMHRWHFDRCKARAA